VHSDLEKRTAPSQYGLEIPGMVELAEGAQPTMDARDHAVARSSPWQWVRVAVDHRANTLSNEVMNKAAALEVRCANSNRINAGRVACHSILVGARPTMMTSPVRFPIARTASLLWFT